MNPETYEMIYQAFHDALSRLTTEELREMAFEPYRDFQVK